MKMKYKEVIEAFFASHLCDIVEFNVGLTKLGGDEF